MRHQEKWTDLNNRLKSAQRIEPLNGFVRDGIVNLEKWHNQKIRPLFIGKEAHPGKKKLDTSHKDHGWSMTEHTLSKAGEKTKLDAALRYSWTKIAYISYALQNNFQDYDQNHTDRKKLPIIQSLHNIAFINIGKQIGATQTDYKRLGNLYIQNRTFLHEQIELLANRTLLLAGIRLGCLRMTRNS